MSGLDIVVKQEGGVVILICSGCLDSLTSSYLREEVDSQIEAGCRAMIINLLEVEFIDSVGLGTLVVRLHRMVEHGGTIFLVCNRPEIRKMFDVTGLSKIFHIYPSRDEAIRGCGEAVPVAAGTGV